MPECIQEPRASIDQTDILYPDWATQHHAFHNARALCDLAGLNHHEKDLISRCIMVESGFMSYHSDGTPVKNENLEKGKVWSTDWGIVQVNDYYNIGHGKPFSSVEEVLDDPRKGVQFMIDMYKAGRLSMWSSYTSGVYLKAVLPTF